MIYLKKYSVPIQNVITIERKKTHFIPQFSGYKRKYSKKIKFNEKLILSCFDFESFRILIIKNYFFTTALNKSEQI